MQKKNDKRESIESQEKGPFGSIINELRASVAKLRDVIHKKDERIYLLTEELNKVKCRLISYQENNLPSKQYYGKKKVDSRIIFRFIGFSFLFIGIKTYAF